MPSIEIKKKNLLSLVEKDLSGKELRDVLESAKAEIKDETDALLKIELNDTNRPDLWTAAGLARHINQYTRKKKYDHAFSSRSTYRIIVHPGVKNIRPYIVGFIIQDLKIDEDLLLELIQNQEKLAISFGRKRADIAIGIYKYDRIRFPVHYKAVRPEEIKFIPLGMDRELNLREILQQHPKGIEYGSILKGLDRYPVILDSNDRVLSFPPVINSKFIGEVEAGDQGLFIELTGFTLGNLLLVANIFACDLLDRGAAVLPVQVEYPSPTPYSKKITVPHDFSSKMRFATAEFARITGFKPPVSDIKKNLERMGYKSIRVQNGRLSLRIPPYRNDILHHVDVIEDYLIGRGYNSVRPETIRDFTIGSLSKEELFMDRLRDLAIGMDYEEIISNILTSMENIAGKMGNDNPEALKISNPMTENYNVLRTDILPSLFEVEATSAKTDYPHRIFEIGETVKKDRKENYGYKTLLTIGFLNAHPRSNFSEMKSHAGHFLYYCGIDQFELSEGDIPFLLKGRNARILYQGRVLGYLGEVHPEILEKWDVKMPCSVMEFSVDELMRKK